jgi:hypothetical protein
MEELKKCLLLHYQRQNESSSQHSTYCEISSSHDGEYEAQNLLGCTRSTFN